MASVNSVPANEATPKQISASALKTLPQKNNQEKLPKDIDNIKDGFSWKIIAGFRIPYITRLVDGRLIEFVSTRIAEHMILKKYLYNIRSDIYTTCTSVRGYLITDLEAKTLNCINKKYCGKDFQFIAGRDCIICLDDLFHFYEFLEVCYSKLLCNYVSSHRYKCGFIRTDKVSIVPYCTIDGQKYMPLFFFEHDSSLNTESLLCHALKLVNWNLAYLKFCCKLMGIRDSYFATDYWIVVNLDDIKNLFPPETDFQDYWPATLSDSYLITRQKSIGQISPASWFKVLPEVVTDENTLTAPVIPQSTEVMMNQMLQHHEQQQEEIITTPLVQEDDDSNNAAYKVQMVMLDGKIIFGININPCVYSDLMVTLNELVHMVLPPCNVAKCAHVLYKYLKITLLFGKLEQLAILWENKLVRSMNPGDSPMAMLEDIKQVLPELKILVSMQDEAIEQYLSAMGRSNNNTSAKNLPVTTGQK